jgi:hypothetical protein
MWTKLPQIVVFRCNNTPGIRIFMIYYWWSRYNTFYYHKKGDKPQYVAIIFAIGSKDVELRVRQSHATSNEEKEWIKLSREGWWMGLIQKLKSNGNE